MVKLPPAPAITVKPLTAGLWPDLELLFSKNGACGGCWCMFWRLKRSEFERRKGAGNRRAFRRLIQSGVLPGLLAYVGGQPVGWCALGPREQYPALQRSRVLAPVDSKPVWSITCFFVARKFRRMGVSARLLAAAVAYARRQGAEVLEGYPIDPGGARYADSFAWTGLASTFAAAGFVEAARRSPKRPLMRLAMGKR